jgi:fatty acid desaturase
MLIRACTRRAKDPRMLTKQMRDLGEYLRAYRGYVLGNLGWPKALTSVLAWLTGTFVPLWAKTFVQLPSWLAITWMILWAMLGYIFAPYGMWKHHRTQISSSGGRDRK